MIQHAFLAGVVSLGYGLMRPGGAAAYGGRAQGDRMYPLFQNSPYKPYFMTRETTSRSPEMRQAAAEELIRRGTEALREGVQISVAAQAARNAGKGALKTLKGPLGLGRIISLGAEGDLSYLGDDSNRFFVAVRVIDRDGLPISGIRVKATEYSDVDGAPTADSSEITDQGGVAVLSVPWLFPFRVDVEAELPEGIISRSNVDGGQSMDWATQHPITFQSTRSAAADDGVSNAKLTVEPEDSSISLIVGAVTLGVLAFLAS